MPDWFDPLGLTGPVRDSLAAIGDAARLLNPAGASFTWMMTTAARRLEGRRFEVEGRSRIAGRVSRVHTVVPSTSVPVPGISKNLMLWDQVEFSIDEVSVGGRSVEKIEIKATRVSVPDATARSLAMASVSFVATLTAGDISAWLDDAGTDATVDIEQGTVALRPIERIRWLRVSGEPAVTGRRAELRPTAVYLGSVRLAIPRWLSRSSVRDLTELPNGITATGIRFVEGRCLEVALKADDVEVAVDLAKVVTDIGVEGTKSVVRVLGIEA